MILSLLCPMILVILLTFSDVIQAVQTERQASETPATPVGSSDKNCYMVMCYGEEDCNKKLKLKKIMDCTKEKMSSLNSTNELMNKTWSFILAGAPELDDPTKYTECFDLSIGSQKTVIMGCAPKMAAEENFCDYVNKTAAKKGIQVIHCKTCTAEEKPCGVDEPSLESTAVAIRAIDRAVRSETTCIMCQNFYCDKRPNMMDCSKEKMKEMKLVGGAKTMWNLLKAGGEWDDSVKYTECFAMVWQKNNERTRLFGCAPAMVGKKEYCAYVKEVAVKNNYFVVRCNILDLNQSNSLRNGLTKLNPVRKCYMCHGADCLKRQPPKIMDCDKDKMSSMDLTGHTKTIWNTLVASGAELDNLEDYILCIQLKWNNEHGEIWGCGPDFVDEEEFCDFANKTLMKNNYVMSECNPPCLSTKDPCLISPRWKKRMCYLCQDVECTNEKKPRVMNCSEEKMSSMNLTGNAKNAWDLLAPGSADLDDPDKYTTCFKLIWDRETILYGCAPETVGAENFCAYVNTTATKNNRSPLECTTVTAFSYPYHGLRAWNKNKCYTCIDSDCYKLPKIMDCMREKMVDIMSLDKSVDKHWKTAWNLLTIGHPELDDPDKYTSCFRMILSFRNRRAHVIGCAPRMVGNKTFCDYMGTATDYRIYVENCRTCRASEKPCFRDPTWKKSEETDDGPTALTIRITNPTTVSTLSTVTEIVKISRATVSYDRAVLCWIIATVLLTMI